MANLLLPAVALLAKAARASFERKTRHCDRLQEQFLLTLLQRYQDTELGRHYGLAEIRTVEAFRQRVPVQPYSGFQSYTERIFQGATNVLTPDPVVYINISSGSTGTHKLIPVTRRFQRSLGKANLVSIGFLVDALERRGLGFGKALLTNSARILDTAPSGVQYGHASVGVLRMGKFFYEQLFGNPFESLLIEDSRTRHYICLLFALRDRQVRGIVANFPMLILRICHYLEEFADDFLTDLEQGTLPPWLDLTPDLREALTRQWSADPQRAKELRQVLREEGKLTPEGVWRNLAFTGTARGGTSDFYFGRFSTYFPKTPKFGFVYSAAEATFSIYPDVDMDGSVLALESGFFEFIPEAHWADEHPPTVLPAEVEVGKRYRIVVTNYNGFYRYDIGDVVEVVGFYETTPLIVFRYRRGGILSSTSEKTTEYHVTQVMQTLQHKYDLSLEDFCVTLSEDEIPARYLVNIELVKGRTLADPQAFLADFDRELQKTNISYGMKRPDNFIPHPRLRLLAPGSFAIVRQRQLARGVPDSQLKFPHLTEDRQLLADLPLLQEARFPGD